MNEVEPTTGSDPLIFNPFSSMQAHRTVLSGLIVFSVAYAIAGPGASLFPSRYPHDQTLAVASNSSEILVSPQLNVPLSAPQGVIAAKLTPNNLESLNESEIESQREISTPSITNPSTTNEKQETLVQEPREGVTDTATISENVSNSPAAQESLHTALSPQALAPAQQENERASSIVHVIKSKETLTIIWKAYGAPGYGGAKALEAFKEAGITTQSFRPGDELSITLENNDIIAVTKKLKTGDEVTITGDSKDGYSASLKKIKAFEGERTIRGTIHTSFAASARTAAVPATIVDDLVDIFAGRLEFRKDIQSGDSFSVTYVERRASESEKELTPGHIVAASLTTNGKLIAAVRHVGKDGKERFYNESGEAIGNYFLRYPVQFSRISSMFTHARFHPVLKVHRPHNGVDFAAPIGTPVRSIADGVVIDAGYRGGGGNLVKIAHGGTYSTAYLHLSKISPQVKKGAKVSRGQVIGAVGMTGLSSGPHLHFSFYEKGRYVDPLKVKLPNISPMSEKIPAKILLAALNTLKGDSAVAVAALQPKQKKG